MCCDVWAAEKRVQQGPAVCGLLSGLLEGAPVALSVWLCARFFCLFVFFRVSVFPSMVEMVWVALMSCSCV